MSAERILILFSSLVAITCALLFAFMERHRAIGPDVQSMTIAIGVIVISALGILVVLRGLFKDKMYVRFGLFSFIVAFCCLTGWVFGEAWSRARCCAWGLVHSSTLQGIAWARAEEIHNGVETLTPLSELLAGKYGEPVVDNYCGCMTSHIIEDAKLHPPAPDDAWEKVGPYVLARRRELWTTQDRQPLLAYALPTNKWEWATAYSGTLGSVDALHTSDDSNLLTFVESSLAEAIALGASPPPDDVVDEVQRWLSSKGR